MEPTFAFRDSAYKKGSRYGPSKCEVCKRSQIYRFWFSSFDKVVVEISYDIMLTVLIFSVLATKSSDCAEWTNDHDHRIGCTFLSQLEAFSSAYELLSEDSVLLYSFAEVPAAKNFAFIRESKVVLARYDIHSYHSCFLFVKRFYELLNTPCQQLLYLNFLQAEVVGGSGVEPVVPARSITLLNVFYMFLETSSRHL